ncbi:SNF-related serine/threonine-protein kinase [Lingula anatina]|uniref:non-specific serine/threonine protein kinase n=1 Tax=Lingula anatina TaxID=7574 RepID=A0A1S3H6K9_LINAN|nr:SNF-related serine/threonine-protein kinase [Lingula anatina]|eukprot:XP_013381755.1 SNF-related serine/threonine-protein kinase [Lingula anatina]
MEPPKSRGSNTSGIPLFGDASMSKKKQVGDYTLTHILGRGSFASVRLGTHLPTKEKVAVKVVEKDSLDKVEARHPEFKGQWKETEIHQSLDHPHIVRLYEILETKRSFYLVLELVEGGSLIDHLTKRGPLSENECRRYMVQIVSALHHIHRVNVVHRDLKLENFLLDNNNNIKVIDFGLSGIWQQDNVFTLPCGSPAYVAPEILGKRRYGPAVDLWSIGVSLYALLTGNFPFNVKGLTDPLAIHEKISKRCFIPQTLSEACQDLLRKLLEPNVKRRLTLSELMNHPWLTTDAPLLLITTPAINYNHNIINYMAKTYKWTEGQICEAVRMRKTNDISATYFLLMKKLERQRSKFKSVCSENPDAEVGVTEEGNRPKNPQGQEGGKGKAKPCDRDSDYHSDDVCSSSKPENTNQENDEINEADEEKHEVQPQRSSLSVIRGETPNSLLPAVSTIAGYPNSEREGTFKPAPDPSLNSKRSSQLLLGNYRACLLKLKECSKKKPMRSSLKTSRSGEETTSHNKTGFKSVNCSKWFQPSDFGLRRSEPPTVYIEAEGVSGVSATMKGAAQNTKGKAVRFELGKNSSSQERLNCAASPERSFQKFILDKYAKDKQKKKEFEDPALWERLCGSRQSLQSDWPGNRSESGDSTETKEESGQNAEGDKYGYNVRFITRELKIPHQECIRRAKELMRRNAASSPSSPRVPPNSALGGRRHAPPSPDAFYDKDQEEIYTPSIPKVVITKLCQSVTPTQNPTSAIPALYPKSPNLTAERASIFTPASPLLSPSPEMLKATKRLNFKTATNQKSPRHVWSFGKKENQEISANAVLPAAETRDALWSPTDKWRSKDNKITREINKVRKLGSLFVSPRTLPQDPRSLSLTQLRQNGMKQLKEKVTS